ncbi:MAG TPA: D-alanine--D-alanine ligase [Planctomycetaceae bacterium]|nr:D-alanine--D-alanine ligase [Planctomycetaceae bacterium]
MENGTSASLGPARVAVLAGGDSSERAVSLESGAAVAQALAGRGHDVTPIDPAGTSLAGVDWPRFDVAFLALHGRFGEDGQVQALLETAGVPYTGSGAESSRLAFSKSASKERFLQAGVPTLPYVLIHQTDAAARIARQARKLGFPLVVKPDRQGSSFGVSLVPAPEALPQALARCFSFDDFGLLEPAVIGSEWTVGLIDGVVLPAIEIETGRAFFDYEAKYADDATRYRFDYSAPPRVVRAIERAGRRAAAAVGTRGIARVDLMLDRLDRPWVLEVNTIPGFTSHSLVPKAAARAGISFGELCERAMQSAVRAAAMSPARRKAG